MGRQINFFLHQEDQIQFDGMLKGLGELVLLPYYHRENKVSTIEDTLIRNLQEEGGRVYLMRKQDFVNIPLKQIQKFGYWLVDDDALPIIHFDRCVTTENKIAQGRLYFQTDYVDRTQMAVVKKPDDFIKWADKIVKTVRRKLNKEKHSYNGSNLFYTEYLGDRALRWKKFNRAEYTGGELRSTTIN